MCARACACACVCACACACACPPPFPREEPGAPGLAGGLWTRRSVRVTHRCLVSWQALCVIFHTSHLLPYLGTRPLWTWGRTGNWRVWTLVHSWAFAEWVCTRAYPGWNWFLLREKVPVGRRCSFGAYVWAWWTVRVTHRSPALNTAFPPDPFAVVSRCGSPTGHRPRADVVSPTGSEP